MPTPPYSCFFLHGLRVDTIAAGFAVAPLVVLLPFLGHRGSWSLWKRITSVWALITFALFLFMELATPTFISEYDTRPNRLFIEYLNHPKEMLSMLWEGYMGVILSGVLICVVLTVLFAWLLRPWRQESQSGSYLKALLVWPLVVFAVFMSIRSSTDLRCARQLTDY